MRVAFSMLNGRIAPVFDSSRCLLILDIESGNTIEKIEHQFLNDNPYHKVRMIMIYEINIIVCGAISQWMNTMLQSVGIQTIAFVSGEEQAIIKAFLKNKLNHPDYLMPGCKHINQ